MHIQGSLLRVHRTVTTLLIILLRNCIWCNILDLKGTFQKYFLMKHPVFLYF